MSDYTPENAPAALEHAWALMDEAQAEKDDYRAEILTRKASAYAAIATATAAIMGNPGPDKAIADAARAYVAEIRRMTADGQTFIESGTLAALINAVHEGKR